MKTYYVQVEKMYFDNEYPEITEMVYGYFPVAVEQVKSKADAIEFVNDLMTTPNCLQTIDPRIVWDRNGECFDIPEDRKEYCDSSFGTTGEVETTDPNKF